MYSNCNLTELPRLSNKLIYLYCDNNCLTKLPEQLPNSLKYLGCSNNRLTTFPEQLPNTLVGLSIINNRLTRLPERLPNTLRILYWNDNPFLFTLKNNLQKFPNLNNINVTSFNNYKVLVRILSQIQLKNRLYKYMEIRGANPKDSLRMFLNRDISRECSKY